MVAQLMRGQHYQMQGIKEQITTQNLTHLGCTYHVLSRILCRPSFSVTSAGDMADRESAHNLRLPTSVRGL